MGSDILKQVTPWRWSPSWPSLLLSGIIFVCAAAILSTVYFVLPRSFSAQDISWASIWIPWSYSLKIAFATCFICTLIAPACAWCFWQLKLKTHYFDQILALPYCLPTVAVGGMIVLLYGNAGLINHVLIHDLKVASDPVGFLYQDASPLLGTIWMNLSLGVLLILRQWNAIPASQWRQAELMNFTGLMKARYIIFPAIRTSLVPWLGIVFLACFNSFGLMLMLSGSPSATTIELATWQSLFMEADWTRAGVLMSLQLTSSLLFIGLFWRVMRRTQTPFAANQSHAVGSFQTQTKSFFRTAIAILGVTIFALFYLMPVVALFVDVLRYASEHPIGHVDDLFRATVLSSKNALIVGFLAATVAATMGPAIQRSLGFQREKFFRWFSFVTWIPAIVPGMVCAFAILVWSSVTEWTWFKSPSIWFLQSFLALPIAVTVYKSGWISSLAAHFRIKEELGLSSWQLWQKVEFPAMWKWAATAGVIAAGLSISDITVVSFLAESDNPPLTMLIARLMGSYQFGEASLIILILVLLSTALFLLSTYRLKGVIRDRMS